MDSWADLDSGITLGLTSELVEKLVEHGYVPSEDKRWTTTSPSITDGKDGNVAVLFSRKKVPEAPGVEKPSAGTGPDGGAAAPDNFVMFLQQTDAGSGQVTRGASKRSPEIFIPLAALRMHEGFWGYPDEFQEDPHRQGKMDRRNVQFSLPGQGIFFVNMMTWPVKHDFRLRHAKLRDSAEVGDVLHLRRARGVDVAYQAQIIGPKNPEYHRFLARCDNPVHNSKKKFGYY